MMIEPQPEVPNSNLLIQNSHAVQVTPTEINKIGSRRPRTKPASETSSATSSGSNDSNSSTRRKAALKRNIQMRDNHANFTPDMFDESHQVLKDLRNIYELSPYEILEFRNILLKKMSIKELRILMNNAEDVPQLKQSTAQLKKRKKAVEQQQPVKDKPEQAAKKEIVNRPTLFTPTKDMFALNNLVIKNYKVCRSTQPFNTVRICNATSRLFYDIQYETNNDWYKTIFSIGLRDIRNVTGEKFSVNIELHTPAIIEVSYRNGSPYYPDIASADLCSSLLHQLELCDSMKALTLRLILSTKKTDAVMKVEPNTEDSFKLNFTTGHANLLQNPQLKTPDSSFLNNFQFIPQTTWNSNPLLTAPSLYTTSSYRMQDYTIAPMENTDYSRPNVVVNNTDNVATVMSSYAHEMCSHDSEYAKTICPPMPPVQSEYLINSLQGHSYYVSDPNNQTIAPYSNTFCTYDSSVNRNNSTILDNTGLGIPAYTGTIPVTTGQTDDTLQRWNGEQWGAGAKQLGGY